MCYCRDWIRSYIRCIVWHPNCFKIAVAGLDDIVRIYTDEPAIVPVLKVSGGKIFIEEKIQYNLVHQEKHEFLYFEIEFVF